MRRSWHIVLAASAGILSAACAHRDGTSGSGLVAPVADHCEMAAAALRASVRDQREVPLGLDVHCAQEYAGVRGTIYVDARFTKNGKLESISDKACTRDNFAIRFQAQATPPGAPPGVVSLSVDEPTPNGRPFFVTIEQADWMKRPSNVLAMSPCYPASGILTQATGGKGWTARVIQPPRGPDEL